MFDKLKNWWKNFTKFTPRKKLKDMTDQECMDEFSKAWHDYIVMQMFMTPIENTRMVLLQDELKQRGYDVYGSISGVKYEKHDKRKIKIEFSS